MPSVFRRKSTDLVTDAVDGASASSRAVVATAPGDDDASLANARAKAYTPSKGRATPKRKEAGGSRPTEPPPRNRREAYRRLRDKQKVERAEARAGMMAGKEENLLARDRGPERRLVRDIVDARRNIGSWFFLGALIVIFGSSEQMPAAVRVGANLFWILLAVAVIIDSFILCRKAKTLIQERFPKTTVKMGGIYFYAVMRAVMFRRFRMPAPAVKIGQKV